MIFTSTYFFGGRKMKKRWLSVMLVVLAICLVLPLVAACGGKKPSGNTNTTTNTGSNNTNTGTGGENEKPEDEKPGENENPGEKPGSATVLESKSAPSIKYLRIAEIGLDSTTIKLNLVGTADSYDVRYSTKEITAKNFAKATEADFSVSGDGIIKTIVVNGVTGNLDDCYYIAVQASNDFASSTLETVRVGGNKIIYLDSNKAQQLYNGETNRDLTALIDEQLIVGDPLRDDYDELPASVVPRFWDEAGIVYHNHTTTTTHERFGTQLAPIIDLEYVHYVDTVMLYYGSTTYDVIVRVSKDAANFNTPEAWDAEYIFKRNNDRIADDMVAFIKRLLNNGRDTAHTHAHVTMKELNYFAQGLGTAWKAIDDDKSLTAEEKVAQQTALVQAGVAAQKQYLEELIAALKSYEETKDIGEALDAMYQDRVNATTDPNYTSNASKLEAAFVETLNAKRKALLADETAREAFEKSLAVAIAVADRKCDVAYDDVPSVPKVLINEFATNLDYELLSNFAFCAAEVGMEARYVQVQFKDGQAPSEALVYGYQLYEDESMLIQEKEHKLPTVGEMMGQCGFVAGGGGNCTIEQLACSYVVREYHNVGWSYSIGSFPGKATKLINTTVGNFDEAYKTYSEAGLLVIPCLQWNEGSAPARIYDEFEGKLSSTVASWEEKYLPSTYAAYADLIYQYSARYGSSKMGYLVENIITHSDATPGATVGRGHIKWIELGNEPNGEDAAGATPYQLAALTSAAYDGHQRTLLADVYNPNSFTYPFGGKTADPDIKLAIAGLAGIQNRYIMTMTYWMRANRTDNSIAMDAFNVHTYFGKYFYMNGQSIIVGVSPEEFGLVDAMSQLVDFRDKYYPDVEVWLTEFGWDTNQSYETMTSAHAYDTKDLNGDGEISEYEMVMRSREIQGMWLVRAYIMLASCGVDKATMYMCEDAAGDEVGAIGKYGTCGIWTTARMPETRYQIFDAVLKNEKGEKIESMEVYQVPVIVENDKGEEETKYEYYRTSNNQLVVIPEKGKIETSSKMEPKDGYYYMYTLFKTLGSMTFVKEIDSGNKDVWVYEFADENGKVGYAVWCPTSNGTVVEDFELVVNGNKATLVESDSKNADIDGVSTNLEIVNNKVTITVSENPVYVIVE